MDLLEVAKELGIKDNWLIIVLGLYGMIRAVQWFFSGAGNWRTPFESRLRDETDVVQRRLADETDPVLQALLEKERQRLVFKERTGIDAPAQHRQQLIDLENRVSPRFGWRDVKGAYSYMKFDSAGSLMRGIDPAGWMMLILFVPLAALLLLGGLYVGVFMPTPADLVDAARLSFSMFRLFLEAVLMLLGFLAFLPIAPVIRALQFQKYIQNSPQNQQAGAAPPPAGQAPPPAPLPQGNPQTPVTPITSPENVPTRRS